MTTATTTLSWTKPALERHAHVGETLANALQGVTPAAKDLAHYLFRICISGKLEEINLYTLSLGSYRRTEKRGGKEYARTTLRRALFELVGLSLVIIDREFRGGWFRLTVKHPGETRPFTHTKREFSKFGGIRSGLIENGAETLIRPFSTTEIFTEAKQDLPQDLPIHSPPANTIVEPPPCQGQGTSSASASLRPLDKEPPARQPKSHGGNEEKISLPEEENPEGDTEPNPDEEAIIRAVRDVCPMTPQLRREVVKFTLLEIEGALTLYRERNEKNPITNAAGFLVKALQGEWARKKTAKRGSRDHDSFPEELTRWYEWASREGLVDGRPLRYLPHGQAGSAVSSTSAENLLVALRIPHDERWPWEGEYRLIPWQEARRLYPMPE
jgi:hypothetical protein